MRSFRRQWTGRAITSTSLPFAGQAYGVPDPDYDGEREVSRNGQSGSEIWACLLVIASNILRLRRQLAARVGT